MSRSDTSANRFAGRLGVPVVPIRIEGACCPHLKVVPTTAYRGFAVEAIIDIVHPCIPIGLSGDAATSGIRLKDGVDPE